ncbi:transcription factor GTE [Salix suchowensis]|nr:transcription factor GTE [Salix suchowensis]
MASESVVGEGGNEGGRLERNKGLKKNSLINTAITTTTTDNNSNTNITTTTTDNNSNANIITTTTAATGENDVNTTTTTATATTETATAPTTTAATGENDINTTTTTATATTETATAPTTTSTAAIATKTTSTEATETATGNETNDKENYEKDLVEVREPEPVAVEDRNTGQQVQQPVSHSIVVSDDSTRLNREEVQEVVPSTREQVVERELPVGNGVLLKGLDNRVKVNLLSRSSRRRGAHKEVGESLVKKIEVKELQLSVGRLSHSRVVLANDGVDRRLRRVNSEVGSVGVHRESTTPIFTPTPRQFRPLNQLSISVLENSQGVGEFVEKEKRTPKANQFYRNSEFLLAKDKFPPAESNKKSKLNGRKQGAGELGFGFGTGTKVFKNCSALLDKLMKHKHGWVFNTPVDVTGLGLHDYFTIIKHPMDLGTVKSRLTKNWYKSPEEFAEDVRLTFHNAMKYNPEGQDVHVMAEQLLDIFETKWSVIKSDYDHEMRFAASYEVGIPTPTSRKNPFVPPPLDMRRILDRSVSMPYPIIDTRPKPITTTPSGRTPVPKKPKAKDPNKRDMTYDEKQKLSTNLQNLPSEKLDNIVQIIKKRSSALSQHDDEIEVDIDSVDVETLWELDRFVTNYKKSLSKNKRKAELAIQARAESQLNVQQKVPAPVVVEAPKETKADERNVSTLSPNHVEKQRDNGSRSSSSSSSSSDSGSSSSDSDSDSSSASGSDVGN